MKEIRSICIQTCMVLGLLILCVSVFLTGMNGEKEPQWQYNSTSGIDAIALSGDGQYSVIGSEDRNISYVSSGNPIPLWSYHAEGSVNAVSLSANGSSIILGTDDNIVYYFGGSRSIPSWSFLADGSITEVDISSNGDILVAASGDTIYVFEAENSVPIWNFTADTTIEQLGISSDGTHIIASSADSSIYAFTVEDDTPLWNFSAGGKIQSISISSDGDHILIGSDDNYAYYFEFEDRTPVWNFSTDNPIIAVSISSDGDHLAIGTTDQRVVYFSGSSNVPIWDYTTTSPIRSVEISENGMFIASGTEDGTAHFFSNDGNVPIWSYSLDGEVIGLALSQDGFSLALGTSNNSVYLFTRVSAYIQTLAPNPVLRGDDVTLACKGFSDDGAITEYLWNSDIDGEMYRGTINSIDISFSFGMHQITARVKDEHGTWSGPTQSSLIVSDKPKAHIDDIHIQHINDEYGLFFTGHGTVRIGEIDQYRWFSTIDGLLYSGPDPSFYYNGLTPGDQTIRLSVRNNYGFWSDEEIVGYFVNDRPVAVIEVIDPDPGIFGEDMFFSGEAQDADAIVRYIWTSSIDGEFFNGTTGTFTTDTLSLGEHNISFKVQDEVGFWSLVASKTIVIQKRPKATIKDVTSLALFKSQKLGLTADWEDDGDITEFYWESLTDGDLYRGTEPSFSTSSLSIGIHNISLTIKDNYGVWSVSANVNITVLRIPNIHSAYLGGNRVMLSWLSELEIAPIFWVNGGMQSGNSAFSREMDEIVQFEEGNNSYYIRMELQDGSFLQTPTLYLDIEKEGVFSDPYVDITVRSNSYRAIEIGEMREIGEISDIFPEDTILEFQIRADKPLDIMLLYINDYRDWESSVNKGKGEIHYYEDFSFFNTSNVSFSFEILNEKALYLILDNTKFPNSGTFSSKDIHVKFSLYVIENPMHVNDSNYTKISEQIDGEGISSSDGSSFSMLIIIIIIVAVLVGGGKIAYDKGLFPLGSGERSEEEDEESENNDDDEDDEYSEDYDDEYDEDDEYSDDDEDEDYYDDEEEDYS